MKLVKIWNLSDEDIDICGVKIKPDQTKKVPDDAEEIGTYLAKRMIMKIEDNVKIKE